MKFNLQKESERVRFVLEKRKLPPMRAAVGFTLDVSGSTQGLYTGGVIQSVVQQIIPVGLRFDDNGSLDAWTFNNGDSATEIAQATADNYEGFVEREIIRNSAVPKWGGTDYAPVLQMMLRKYGFLSHGNAQPTGLIKRLFGRSSGSNAETLGPNSRSGEAVINYFITDGQNEDKDATYTLLQQCEKAKANIYFLFIGVGSQAFPFLERIAKDFGNTGFLNVTDLQKFVDSDDIYEQLLPEELTGWLKQKQS